MTRYPKTAAGSALRAAERHGRDAVAYFRLGAAPKAIAPDACEDLAARHAREAWSAAGRYLDAGGTVDTNASGC